MVLDFHGDPVEADLFVFSDGNHHMALEASVRAFLAGNPDVGDVFYTTTPPSPLVDSLKGNGLTLGNLRISRKPDVFIGPSDILEELTASGFMTRHIPFAESRGNVLLVRKGNPKDISSVADLLSKDVILTCSNPVTEKASFEIYKESVIRLAQSAGIDQRTIIEKLSVAGPNTVHSQFIHHREVPELIGVGLADAAMVYYHLALRYTRIFPDLFDYIDIGGVLSEHAPIKNPTTRYHIGLVTDGGQWGARFVAFMQGDEAQRLYEEHGLAPLCRRS